MQTRLPLYVFLRGLVALRGLAKHRSAKWTAARVDEVGRGGQSELIDLLVQRIREWV